MNEDKAEYRNKQRSSFWWASLMWCLLLVLAYFGVDIIEGGKALNEMTEYPIWGYVLWAFIVIVLWVLVIGPIVHFTNLRYVGEESLPAQVSRINNAVQEYRREPQDSELRRLADEFSAAPRDFSSLEGKNGWQELLARFREAVHGRAHDTIIGYCKAVGVGVVFCFNGLLGGCVLFALQLRLALVLARMFAFKPAAAFNGYFFAWLIVNSLAFAFTNSAVGALSTSAIDTLMGAAGGTEVSSLRIGMEYGLKALIQALAAGLITYITGRVMLWRLEYEHREVTLKAILKLRLDTRREYEEKERVKKAAIAMVEQKALEQKPSDEVAEKLMQLFGYGEGQPATPALGESKPTTPAKLPEPRPAATEQQGTLPAPQKAEAQPVAAVPAEKAAQPAAEG